MCVSGKNKKQEGDNKVDYFIYALIPIGYYRLQSRVLHFRFKPILYFPIYFI